MLQTRGLKNGPKKARKSIFMSERSQGPFTILCMHERTRLDSWRGVTQSGQDTCVKKTDIIQFLKNALISIFFFYECSHIECPSSTKQTSHCYPVWSYFLTFHIKASFTSVNLLRTVQRTITVRNANVFIYI